MWELAALRGLPTSDVMRRLDQLGHPVASHASTVPASAAELFLSVTHTAAVQTTPVGQSRALLWSHVRQQRGSLVALLGLSVMGSAVALLAPFPLKVLADEVLPGGRPPATLAWLPAGTTGTGAAAWLAAGTIVLFLLGSLVDVRVAMRTVRLTQTLVYAVSRDVLAAVQRSPAQRRDASVGDALGRVMVDPYGIPQILLNTTVLPAQLLLSVTMSVVIMRELDAPLAGVVLGVAVAQTALAFLYGRVVRGAALRAREEESRLQAHVHHLITGISVVQAFAQERREAGRFRQQADRTVAAHQRAAVTSSLSTLGPSVAAAIGAGVVLYFGVQRVLSGGLTVGGLLVFLAYTKRVQAQLGQLATLVPQLNAGRASAQRVLEVLEAEPEVLDRPGARRLPAVRGHLVFENVVFGHEPNRPVLHQVDLEARPGQTIAVVGPSGAGKSTLLSLVPRFHDPWSGRVLLDGHDLRDVKLHDLRAHVSLVLQEPFLFPMSIGENIAYGRPDAPRSAITQAARDANAHEFISQLADGYDTVLGERGATLSGGERQRISIARALLKDAPVLLLDEPTSALDNDSERLLLHALERLMAGRTTLIIAHRLSTIRNADRIVVLDHGRVLETGTHTQLLANAEHYARLHNTPRRRTTRTPSRNQR